MSDALIREVLKRVTVTDHKINVLINIINIMSQVIPKMEGETIKELLDRRTGEFLGPPCNAVADQVLAEIREPIARHSARKPSAE